MSENETIHLKMNRYTKGKGRYYQEIARYMIFFSESNHKEATELERLTHPRQNKRDWIRIGERYSRSHQHPMTPRKDHYCTGDKVQGKGGGEHRPG